MLTHDLSFLSADGSSSRLCRLPSVTAATKHRFWAAVAPIFVAHLGEKVLHLIHNVEAATEELHITFDVFIIYNLCVLH